MYILEVVLDKIRADYFQQKGTIPLFMYITEKSKMNRIFY